MTHTAALMTTAATCKYCNADVVAPASMLRVAVRDAGDVFVVDDPSHPGRCVVAARWHVRELFDLTEQQRNDFMALVNTTARAVVALTACDKVNLAFYGDLSDHLHAHVVPKWKGGVGWGETFALQPAQAVADRVRGPLAGLSMPAMAARLLAAL